MFSKEPTYYIAFARNCYRKSCFWWIFGVYWHIFVYSLRFFKKEFYMWSTMTIFLLFYYFYFANFLSNLYVYIINWSMIWIRSVVNLVPRCRATEWMRTDIHMASGQVTWCAWWCCCISRQDWQELFPGHCFVCHDRMGLLTS